MFYLLKTTMYKTNKELTEKYFGVLVNKYIKKHKPDKVDFVFTDFIEKDKYGKVGGQTSWNRVNIIKEIKTEQKLFGIIPWTNKKTTKLFIKNYFIITFLNQYASEQEWLRTLFHEFTHLYLDLTKGKHDCDENKVFNEYYINFVKLENEVN